MKLFTVGYTGVKLPALQAFVEQENLVLIDSRFQPRSRAPQWNRGPLEKTFGDRYAHVAGFGNVNYKGGPILIQGMEMGIAQVERILQRCDGILLMCVCADLHTCHRKVVSQTLEQHFSVEAVHLSAANFGGKPPTPPAPPVDWDQLLLWNKD